MCHGGRAGKGEEHKHDMMHLVEPGKRRRTEAWQRVEAEARTAAHAHKHGTA